MALYIYSRNLVVNEADGFAEFVVGLSEAGGSTITVNYVLNDGTAEYYSNRDYTDLGGTLSFAPGVTSQTVRVTITNDLVVENMESRRG